MSGTYQLSTEALFFPQYFFDLILNDSAPKCNSEHTSVLLIRKNLRILTLSNANDIKGVDPCGCVWLPDLGFY